MIDLNEEVQSVAGKTGVITLESTDILDFAAAVEEYAPSGGAESFISGEVISGNSVVYLSGGRIYRANYAVNPESIVGITLQAANVSGVSVEVITQGIISGLSLVQDQTYFMSSNGGLTNVRPASGMSLVVGRSKDSTVLIVEFGVPILLA